MISLDHFGMNQRKVRQENGECMKCGQRLGWVCRLFSRKNHFICLTPVTRSKK